METREQLPHSLATGPIPHHDNSPLITLQVMTCAKDLDLLPRAIRSIADQTLLNFLRPEHIELQIVYDGQPPEDAFKNLEAPDVPTSILGTEQIYGYYCVPRNAGIAVASGIYIAFLDADNEWAPTHIEGLLRGIRRAEPSDGWPHFVYSRREYVIDPGAPTDLPAGPSELFPWAEFSDGLRRGPRWNFCDTGDMLWARSALYYLAELSGVMWNPNHRRFADWELVCRAREYGFRGRAIDQVTNIYHWTGSNLQLTRSAEGVDAITPAQYELLRSKERL